MNEEALRDAPDSKAPAAEPSRQQDSAAAPPLHPGRPLRRLTDVQAIWFGHFAIIALGLAYWNFRSNSVITRLVQELSPTRRDFHHFLSYGLPVILGMLVIVHGLAFRAVRKGFTPTRREALAALSRALWPAGLAALAVIAACFVWVFKDPRWYLWAPFQALALGTVAWQFALWREQRASMLERPPAPREHPQPGIRHWTVGALALLVLSYTGWFGYLTAMRHYSMGTALHDFGIYDQLMWNTVNGRWFEAGMFNGDRMNYFLRDFDNNFLAEHFIPTFWIVAPFYWLFPSSITVLMAQTVILALAAAPVYLIALKKLRSPLLGLLFALLYLVHPIVQQTNIKDVHADFLAPVFLLGAFAAYLHGWKVSYWILLLFALGVKEEVSVSVALLGVFLLLGEKDRKMGIATFLLGAAWFVLVIGFVMPWFRNGLPVRQLDRYNVLIPPDVLEQEEVITKGLIARSVLTHPLETLELLFAQARVRGTLSLLAPVAMLALWGRWIWIWILPIVLAMELTHSIHMQEMEHHYGITLMAPVFIGSIWGAWWLLRRDLPPSAPLPKPRLTGAVTALAFMAVINSYEYGFTPGGKRYDPIDYTILPHNELGYRYLEAIPPDAIVSAQLELGGQLTHRRFVYCFPDLLDAEYIFLDTRRSFWPLNDEAEYRRHIWELLESKEWGLILPYEDGYLLFKKGHPADLNASTKERLTFERYRPRRYGL